jgi:hypothetical protein
MNLSEKNAAAVRERLGIADRALSAVTERFRSIRERPLQLVRNRQRLAGCEQALEATRTLLAECQEILDGTRRSCCPTPPGGAHLGTCPESVMSTGKWNP